MRDGLLGCKICRSSGANTSNSSHGALRKVSNIPLPKTTIVKSSSAAAAPSYHQIHKSKYLEIRQEKINSYVVFLKGLYVTLFQLVYVIYC
jgi:hypothetical protein